MKEALEGKNLNNEPNTKTDLIFFFIICIFLLNVFSKFKSILVDPTRRKKHLPFLQTI